MGMNKAEDMPDVWKPFRSNCNYWIKRNPQIHKTGHFYEDRGTYMNYEYHAKHDKTITTETSYTNHGIHQAFADQMLKGTGEFYARI